MEGWGWDGLEIEMQKWRCKIGGYIYDPEMGDPDGNIPPNTPFDTLPEDWVCPVCGAPKDMFEKD
jgi:rubredoxin